jgi:uncharacterized protein YggE
MSIRNVAWISALVLLASAFAGVGLPRLVRADSGAQAAATISVVGTGVVEAAPDTASVSAGVTTQAATASAAMTSNGAAMTKVIDALKAAGVAAKDLQTEVVSLAPRYGDDGAAVTGYTASNVVSATVRDVARTGDVVDAAVGAGANTVDGPSLTRDDSDRLYRDALEQAVAQARLKALALARASGATLGAIRSVSEGAEDVAPGDFAANAARAAATPIETGAAEITANVRVVFAIS